MRTVNINDLPEAAELDDNDVIPVNQNDSTRKARYGQIKDPISQLVINETQARIQGDKDTLSSAKDYTNQTLLALNEWLPPVKLKSNLVVNGLKNTINYLCKVVADGSNSGVYQATAGWEGTPIWALYDNGVDFVEEGELTNAINVHNINTASHQVTLTDDADSQTLKPAGKDSLTNWLQSIRNNLKTLLSNGNEGEVLNVKSGNKIFSKIGMQKTIDPSLDGYNDNYSVIPVYNKNSPSKWGYERGVVVPPSNDGASRGLLSMSNPSGQNWTGDQPVWLQGAALKNFIDSIVDGGPQGTIIFPVTVATPSAPVGWRTGDLVLNAGTATITILGISTTVGGLVKIATATTGTAAGNIRGATGTPGRIWAFTSSQNTGFPDMQVNDLLLNSGNAAITIAGYMLTITLQPGDLVRVNGFYSGGHIDSYTPQGNLRMFGLPMVYYDYNLGPNANTSVQIPVGGVYLLRTSSMAHGGSVVWMVQSYGGTGVVISNPLLTYSNWQQDVAIYPAVDWDSIGLSFQNIPSKVELYRVM